MDRRPVHPNIELRIFEAARMGLALSRVLPRTLQQEVEPRLPREHEELVRNVLSAVESQQIFSDDFLVHLRDLLAAIGATIDDATTEVEVEEKGYLIPPGKAAPTRSPRCSEA